ncbi:MAG: DNA repair protein RecN (Recombination protein N) [Chitinophagales bacterium]|jgi:DNA repair protein RecN (Recombination protein N)
MLSHLDIKNYAIIQHVSLDFDKGLNIITGETGAGKSILLGALGLSLGDRADTKVLYSQSEKCIIEAKFYIANYQLEQLFEKLDLDYDEHTIVRREISPNGKSRAFVNDTPINLESLRMLAEKMVNLTSQNETQQLNKESYQLEILDAVVAKPSLLLNYQDAFSSFSSLKKEIASLEAEQIQLQNDFDFHSYQLNEIEEAQLEGENLETLEKELATLSHAESIKANLQNIVQLIDNGETSVIQLLNEAFYQLKEIEKFSAKIEDLGKRLDSSIIELEDLKNEAESIAEGTSFDEERIAQVSTKVNECNRLIRKHQVQSIEELMVVRDKLLEQTSATHSNSVQLNKLKLRLDKAQEILSVSGDKLSAARKKATTLVVKDIEETMQKVGMPNAVFEATLEDKTDYGITGKDRISFQFNANKGFAPQALKKIASGGELSRVLLSIQSLLAKKTALPTLVFDEIDTGISGETAAKVAEVFREISKNHQLIAITHLPQIAAKAEKHFFIYKNDDKDKTETKIAALDSAQHIKAIARMLSGETISEESLSNARSLINV